LKIINLEIYNSVFSVVELSNKSHTPLHPMV